MDGGATYFKHIFFTEEGRGGVISRALANRGIIHNPWPIKCRQVYQLGLLFTRTFKFQQIIYVCFILF